MDILHCDLNNFYASVEQAENPLLKDKFIAVSGNPEVRHGIILAKNQAAKAMGVKTGEAIWQARKKCPDLVCLPPHFEYYVNYSRRVREIYGRYTDTIESFGMDECWLDISNSGIMGTPFEIAEKLRRDVRNETGLTISVGVSFNKVFAKLGSDMKKPDATTVIDRNNFREKVWPLDVSEMLYVGSKTREKLNRMGIFTLGDLANANAFALKKTFGINGEKMRRAAAGEDDEPVRPAGREREIKSVGHGTTTLRDMESSEDADKVIFFLSDMVATRLRRYGLRGSVVHLDIRLTDLTHRGKQAAISSTYVAQDIYRSAAALLRKIWKGGEDSRLRSLSVYVSRLKEAACGVQMSLFDIRDEKHERLEYSLDLIRKKYGFDAIKRASLAGNDLVTDKFFGEEDLLPFKR